MNSTTIIGIDPGSRHTGYAIIHISGSKLSLSASGRISPKATLGFTERLGVIFRTLAGYVAEYKPHLMSIEDVHVAHNPRSALKLGQSRGIAIATASLYEVPIFDCTPSLVKKTITSYGAASKEQVAYMVGKIFGKEASSADESDAIAIALCAYHYAPQFSSYALYKA